MKFPGATHLVILVRGSREEAEKIKDDLAQFIAERLQMNLSKEKTLITHIDDGFDFLGFNIRRFRDLRQLDKTRYVVHTMPSRKSLEKLKAKIRELSCEIRKGTPLEFIITRTNHILRRWGCYFRIGPVKNLCAKLDWWIWHLYFKALHKLHRGRKHRSWREHFLEFTHPYTQDIDPKHRQYNTRGIGIRLTNKRMMANLTDATISPNYHLSLSSMLKFQGRTIPISYRQSICFYIEA